MKKFSFIAVFALVLALSLPALAQDAGIVPDEAFEESSAKFKELQEEIRESQRNLTKTLLNTSLIEERLSDVSEEVKTLEDAVDSINSQLAQTELNINIIDKNILVNQNEVRGLNSGIADLIDQVDENKTRYAELLVILYFENESAGFFDSDQLQALKLLLNDEGVSDILERRDSLALLEVALEDLVDALEIAKAELVSEKEDLKDATIRLEALRAEENKQRVQLQLQKDAKAKVLEVTKGEEEIYQELLARAKREQLVIRQDINELVGDYAEIKSRLGKDGFAEDDFGTGEDDGKLSWPILPNLGISALFRDAAYRAAIGVDHNAIDIPAYMRTDVFAAADGIVMKVKGGEGLDYRYIIVAHNDGLMTLYGHVFDTLVKSGDRVMRGQLIALSGGAPGTNGAGWLTTGPHLHFEVFFNGVHVDPLDYLLLEEIPEEYLE